MALAVFPYESGVVMGVGQEWGTPRQPFAPARVEAARPDLLVIARNEMPEPSIVGLARNDDLAIIPKDGKSLENTPRGGEIREESPMEPLENVLRPPFHRFHLGKPWRLLHQTGTSVACRTNTFSFCSFMSVEFNKE